MPAKTDVVKGALKIQGLLEDLCFEDVKELIKALPQYLSVEIPSSISNVVVGVEQPGAGQRDNLWVRTANSGNFVGVYVYALGQWRQIIPVPVQLVRVYGDSRNPPEGYTLATEAGVLTESQKLYLKGTWHWHNDVADTYYDIFDVIYTGF